MESLGSRLPLDRPVAQLPVGARQVVEIAKALYRDARILILDEPTSALSPPEAARLFDLIAGLRKRTGLPSCTGARLRESRPPRRSMSMRLVR